MFTVYVWEDGETFRRTFENRAEAAEYQARVARFPSVRVSPVLMDAEDD